MAITVIVKNNTGASVFIEDMGIAVPGSSQIIFSEIFDFSDICESSDLKDYVGISTFIINDGTSDLSVSDAISYLKCKNTEIAFDDIGGLFGVQTLQSSPISSTTSTTYIDKLEIIIAAADNEAGQYLLLCNADFQSLNNNKQVSCRLYDKTNAVIFSESVQQTNNNTNWFSFANHESINFDGLTDLNIAIQYKTNGNTTCNIRNANLSLWRVG